MSKSTITIDGKKLLKIIERKGLNPYDIPLEMGYTKNVIMNAAKVGRASVLVQNLLTARGIAKEDYMIVEDAFTVNHAPDKDDRLMLSVTLGELEDVIRKVVREELERYAKER